jgi:hypothetical protein
MKEKREILYIIIIVILIVTLVIFLVLYLNDKKDTIKSGNAPKILSSFAVIPSVNVATLKQQKTCTSTANGSIGTQNCNFNGVTSLEEAITICNKYSGAASYAQCNGFTYSYENQLLTFITTGYLIETNTQQNAVIGDVYLRQSNF